MTDPPISAPLEQHQLPSEGNHTDQPLPGAQNGSQGTETASQEEPPPATNREAAYRVRARDAEAARDALTERVTNYQRAEVERQAAKLHNPADLWQHVEIVELLDEKTGDLDSAKVAEALAALADSKPYLYKKEPTPRFAQGEREGVDQPEKIGWGTVLNNSTRTQS